MDTIKFYAEWVAYAALFVVSITVGITLFDSFLGSAVSAVFSRIRRKK